MSQVFNGQILEDFTEANDKYILLTLKEWKLYELVKSKYYQKSLPDEMIFVGGDKIAIKSGNKQEIYHPKKGTKYETLGTFIPSVGEIQFDKIPGSYTGVQLIPQVTKPLTIEGVYIGKSFDVNQIISLNIPSTSTTKIPVTFNNTSIPVSHTDCIITGAVESYIPSYNSSAGKLTIRVISSTCGPEFISPVALRVLESLVGSTSGGSSITSSTDLLNFISIYLLGPILNGQAITISSTF